MEITTSKKLISAIAIAAGIIVIFVAIAIRVAFQDVTDASQSINGESSFDEDAPLQIFPLEFKAMVMEKDVPELQERISSLIHYSGDLENISLDIEYKDEKVNKVNYDSVRVMYLTCRANEIKLIVSCTIYKDQWAIDSIKNAENKNIVYLSKSIEESEALYDFNTGKVIMTYEEQESKKEEASKKKEEESRKQEEDKKNQYISECGSYSYKEIARRPQDYKGKKAKFTGKVMQVSKEYSGYTLLVQVTKSKYGYEDIMYVEYKPKDANESNVLEDDIVTIYGGLDGERTYQSTVGKSITVPLFQCEYITILSE